jgi:hypothetical protein
MKQMELGLEGGESQLQKYVAEGKELRKADRAKPEVSSRPVPSATDSPKLFDIISPKGGGGGGAGIPKVGPKKPMDMKSGGSVSKADMQKAGFYDKGKTKAERQAIVSKVTTKPQRVAIVEKAFSTKNMKSGGKVSSASKRADGCAIRGKTRA